MVGTATVTVKLPVAPGAITGRLVLTTRKTDSFNVAEVKSIGPPKFVMESTSVAWEPAVVFHPRPVDSSWPEELQVTEVTSTRAGGGRRATAARTPTSTKITASAMISMRNVALLTRTRLTKYYIDSGGLFYVWSEPQRARGASRGPEGVGPRP